MSGDNIFKWEIPLSESHWRLLIGTLVARAKIEDGEKKEELLTIIDAVANKSRLVVT